MRSLVRVVSVTGLIFSIFPFALQAQNGLKTTISLEEGVYTLYEVILQTEKQSPFEVAYAPDQLSLDKQLKLQGEYPIDELFMLYLDDGYEIKRMGSHVVIREQRNKEKPGSPSPKKTRYRIEGRIVDSQTGKGIADVTVFDPEKLFSTLTNEEGRYSLVMASKNDYVPLNYSSSTYRDTFIMIQPDQDDQINLSLRKIQPELIDHSFTVKLANKDSVIADNGLVPVFVPQRTVTLSSNVDEVIQRPVQLSVIPYVSTNRKMSGVVANNFSLNLLGGYSYAVKGFEMGGLLNITRNYVEGVQISGFGNYVGGTLSGLQVAGFFNHNLGDVKGVQIAGFQNVVWDTLAGAQIAGFLNLLKGEMRGPQVAGFANISLKDVKGLQLAGFANISGKSVLYFQVSGFLNYAGGNVGGTQASGFANVSLADVGGGQLSGFTNFSLGKVSGIQASGFLNIAREMNGIQLGIVNFADTSSGWGVGLVNIVLKGYQAITYQYDWFGHQSIRIKSGTHKLYNTYVGGMSFDGSYSSFGLGFGHISELDKRLSIGFENDYLQLYAPTNGLEFNLLTQLRANIGLKFAQHFRLTAGPTINLHTFDNDRVNEPDFLGSNHYNINQIGNVKLSSWPSFSMNLSYEIRAQNKP